MRRAVVAVLVSVLVSGALGSAAPALAQSRINAHHTVTAVAQSSVIVRAFSQLRTYLALINDGSAAVYCRVDGETAVANQGIRLSAAGTVGNIYVFDSKVPQGAVTCIAATGTNAILLIEGF